mmetsp:Transcript_4166/g.12540  ORF Transcript_4166/g.12540 Transcript_4166/m.12540 type:complete len:210 (-) Transcript_4166:7-636(-)
MGMPRGRSWPRSAARVPTRRARTETSPTSTARCAATRCRGRTRRSPGECPAGAAGLCVSLPGRTSRRIGGGGLRSVFVVACVGGPPGPNLRPGRCPTSRRRRSIDWPAPRSSSRACAIGSVAKRWLQMAPEARGDAAQAWHAYSARPAWRSARAQARGAGLGGLAPKQTHRRQVARHRRGAGSAQSFADGAARRRPCSRPGRQYLITSE